MEGGGEGGGGGGGEKRGGRRGGKEKGEGEGEKEGGGGANTSLICIQLQKTRLGFNVGIRD